MYLIKKSSFYLLTFALFIPQILFTFNSINQIRYEELAESIRNVYWLQQHHIYDSISSNVGWYGTLLVLYNLLGFRLFYAKFFRLGLHFISLICVAAILKKYLKGKYAWLPLITIAFSPTLLYFNTFQTSYGIDLQYIPITLYLVTSLNPKKRISFFLKQLLLWLVAMIAWMSYPPFIFYLPVLGFLYYLKIKNSKLPALNASSTADAGGKVKSYKPKLKVIHNFKLSTVTFNFALCTLNFIVFLLPLLVVIYYLNPQDRALLFNDPNLQTGIFRGGGGLSFNLNSFWHSLTISLSDLFYQANSYYFELAKVEFSDVYPLMTVIFVLIASIILFKKNIKLRLPIILAWFVLTTTIIFSHLTGKSELAGIRRSTPMLAAFYSLYSVCWWAVGKLKVKNTETSMRYFKRTLVGVCLLLPIHHLLVYPVNLARMKTLSPYREKQWFSLAETPDKSLALMRKQVTTDDLELVCKDDTGQPISCRYEEVFASVAGDCLWNHLPCKQILGYDVERKNFVPLSVE